MPPEGDHKEIVRLLRENNTLAKQNNELLKKLKRYSLVSFLFTILWYGLLIGLPFALYFYVVEPYFEALGSSYDTFKNGLNELPGLRGIEQLLDNTIRK